MRPDNERRTAKELGFKAWFSQVFWYHYKGVVLLVLGVAAVAAVIIVNAATKPETDAVIVIVTEEYTGFDRLYAIKSAAGRRFKARGKDPEISVVDLEINQNTGAVVGVGDNFKLLGTFTEPEMVLYLMDGPNVARYTKEGGHFLPEMAAEYGVSNGVAIPLDTEFFKAMGYEGEKALFALFKAPHYNATEKDAAYYDRARMALDGLLEAE